MKQDPYIGDTRVEVAFATAPNDPAPAFVDVTDFVPATSGIVITQGRLDEFGEVQPGTGKLTLDNTFGYFTAGYAGSPYYPNVKIRKKLRVTVRDTTVAGNMLSVEDATFEGGTVGDWVAAGSVSPALTNSATHVKSGSKAMLITWGTGGSGPGGSLTLTALVIGRQYTVAAQVYVPSGGSPQVRLTCAGVTGSNSAGTNAYNRISVTFTATAASHTLLVAPATGATSGQQVWVDEVQLDEGALVTFTTTPPPIFYEHTGYVDEFPTEWPGGGQYSEVQLTSIDRFKQLGRTCKSIVEEEILSDNPFAYYTLGEPDGATSVGDTSTNGRNSLPVMQLGSGGALTFAAGTGPSTDGLSAPLFAPVNTLNGKYLYGPLGNTSSSGSVGQVLEADFLSTTVALQTMAQLYSTQLPRWILWLGIDSTGHLTGGSFTGSPITSSAVVTDGHTHHAAIKQTFDGTNVSFGLYLDGVLVASSSFVSPLPNYDTIYIGGGNGNGGSLTVFSGTLSHVAAFDTGLADARIADDANAALTGFAGERSDQRIARYARYGGIAAAEQSLEVGLSTSIAFVDITGQSLLQAMQDVESTESGVLFIDGKGVLNFQSRAHRYNTVSTLTLAGDDVDQSTKFVENDAYLVNDVSGSRPGGITYRVANPGSIGDFFESPKTLQLLTTSDNEVIDAVNWKANQTAIATSRLPAMSVDVLTNPTKANAMLGLGISARVTLGTLPTQAPGASTDLFVEGATITITDQAFRFDVNTSPAVQGNVWQLDSASNSQLDSTTRLAY